MLECIKTKPERSGGGFLGGTCYYRDWSWCTVITMACVGMEIPASYHSFFSLFFFLGTDSARICFQPKIDSDSLEMLSTECPRIIVNPKPSPFGVRGFELPQEAYPDIVLDEPYVKDIDPITWAVRGLVPRVATPVSNPNELSVAEKFRLAFVERDTRLTPKRAKNARQHQRRAEKEWMMENTSAKAIALASKYSKYLNSRK